MCKELSYCDLVDEAVGATRKKAATIRRRHNKEPRNIGSILHRELGRHGIDVGPLNKFNSREVFIDGVPAGVLYEDNYRFVIEGESVTL